MKDVFVSNAESIVVCTTLPTTPQESTLSDQCYLGSSSTISSNYEYDYFYSFSQNNVTIIKCNFTNCNNRNGVSVIKTAGSSFYMKNSSVSNCGPIFAYIESPKNDSYISYTNFTGAGTSDKPVLLIQGSNFKLNNVEIKVETEKAFCVKLSGCTKVEFVSSSFYHRVENMTSIVASDSPNLQFSACNFNLTCINLTENSFAMFSSCCFMGTEDLISTDLSSYYSTTGDSFSTNCPIIEKTASLSSEKKAYAITTIVVFFFCFAALFITLIVLVFCKVGSESTPKYGKLHDEDGFNDSTSSDVPTD